MNKEIMRAAGFGTEVDRVEAGLCPLCAIPIKEEEFKNDLSRREFEISGMCQKCQDEIFKEIL